MRKTVRLKEGKKDEKKPEIRMRRHLSKYRRKKKKSQKVDLSVSGEGGFAGIKCAPLHSANPLTGVTPLSKQGATFHDGTFTLTRQQTSLSLPRSRMLEESTHIWQHQNNHSKEYETPGELLNKVESDFGPKKALDFNSLEVERVCSTGEDTFCTPNHCGLDSPGAASGNCYREQQVENDALNNNMACKFCRIKFNVSYRMKICRHNILWH